jgi:hypothetical protein
LSSEFWLLRKLKGRRQVIVAAGEPTRLGTASSEAAMNQVGELAVPVNGKGDSALFGEPGLRALFSGVLGSN